MRQESNPEGHTRPTSVFAIERAPEATGRPSYRRRAADDQHCQYIIGRPDRSACTHLSFVR